MEIIKPVAVLIKDNKYLVARDRNEDFFKNVGGRIKDDETELQCLKRNLNSEIGMELTTEPELIFDLPPTPAAGDLGDTVILRGYLIEDKIPADFKLDGDVMEVVWVNSSNIGEIELTPQIKELIIPKLLELGLIT